jgi:hypothetical protein
LREVLYVVTCTIEFILNIGGLKSFYQDILK